MTVINVRYGDVVVTTQATAGARRTVTVPTSSIRTSLSLAAGVPGHLRHWFLGQERSVIRQMRHDSVADAL